MSYILLTPMMNEAENLPRLRETIMGQTARPSLWVIGDGNSTDGSYGKAAEIFGDCGWVHVIRQKTFCDPGYSHKNFACNINDCYEHARDACRKCGVDYRYVGKVDATPYLSENYFEALMSELENDPGLGFVCGTQKVAGTTPGMQGEQQWRACRGLNDERLYRRELFESLGGYPISYSPDAVIMVKALNSGWKTGVTRAAHFEKRRAGGTKIGCWNGFRMKGRAMYGLGYGPLRLLMNAFYNSRYYPHYQWLPMLYGYLGAAVVREEQIDDGDVRDYFGRIRLRDLLASRR